MSRVNEPPSLLEHAARSGKLGEALAAPLADRMRPRTLDEVCGQRHLIGPGKWLRKAIESDRLVSLIFWGPPGVGKTTLARVVAEATKRRFVPFSAVLGGVADLRAILKGADEERRYRGTATILFIDEIHRFNKGQQDALLPHVESGTVTLIGATTENPSFAINAAVLSRAKVQRLAALSEEDLVLLLTRALADQKNGLGRYPVRVSEEAMRALSKASGGDARRALSLLEAAVTVRAAPGSRASADAARAEAAQVETAQLDTAEEVVTLEVADLEEFVENKTLLYDKSGDEHYNVSSALIKSMRGSDPDAAIYWLMRMLEAGDDPLFLLRRLMIFASEDVGNADPRALQVAVAADEAFRRMGLPEGIYPIAHACLYLASCPKSGAVGKAWHAAQRMVKERGALDVPKKLRNAPTSLMKDEGYGQGYKYAHDFKEGFAPGETYLPEEIVDTRFYIPTEHGLEKAIGERLDRIRAARGKKGHADEE
jgi:putative ATPase